MYDVIIIGLGCAGYTAAIYTARYKLSTLLIGAEDGGMGLTAAEVGNWPDDLDWERGRVRKDSLQFASVFIVSQATVFHKFKTEGKVYYGRDIRPLIRPRFTAWEHEDGEDAVYVAWHSNAPDPGVGTSSYTYSQFGQMYLLMPPPPSEAHDTEASA